MLEGQTPGKGGSAGRRGSRVRPRAAVGRQLTWGGGLGGQSHPTLVRCQVLALEWAKGHEGEWEGVVSSQASSKHWFGGLAGRTGARDKGGRTKV